MDNDKLKGLLADWTDLDVACYHLGQVLDLFGRPAGSDEFRHVRGLFFPSYPNDNGELLLLILDSLVKLGALEYRAQEAQYRWSPDFDGMVRPIDDDDEENG